MAIVYGKVSYRSRGFGRNPVGVDTSGSGRIPRVAEYRNPGLCYRIPLGFVDMLFGWFARVRVCRVLACNYVGISRIVVWVICTRANAPGFGMEFRWYSEMRCSGDLHPDRACVEGCLTYYGRVWVLSVDLRDGYNVP